jgi:hypothetical protein
MSDKLSVICASILFFAIPAMLIYGSYSVYHDGYRQGRKGFTAYGSSRQPEYRQQHEPQLSICTVTRR